MEKENWSVWKRATGKGLHESRNEAVLQVAQLTPAMQFYLADHGKQTGNPRAVGWLHMHPQLQNQGVSHASSEIRALSKQASPY